MSKSDKDQVIAEFTEAYQAKHGKAPSIEAKGGWYSVDGGKNVRLATLEEMTAELSGDEKPAPAKSKKPAAKKSTSKKKSAAKDQGFSVKDFWVEQIESRNPGSKHPR